MLKFYGWTFLNFLNLTVVIYALPVFIDFNLHSYEILTFAYALIYTMNRLHGSSNRKKVSLAICSWIMNK